LKTQSFLDNYFQTGAESGKLAHCMLFYGSDLPAQYDLALEIARMLNCTSKCKKPPNYQPSTINHQLCLSCKWINENKHPAVMTISRVDNKPSSDTSKTVISIEQARMIKNDLAVTSDYHRVLIFCDKDKDGNVCGLNENNFQAEAANALLKTFEEPPSRTTFIFLTKDKTDMISTIISRAQSFYVPSQKDETREWSPEVAYLDIERKDVLGWCGTVLGLETEPTELLEQIQNYILAALRANPRSPKLIADLKAVESAKDQLRLNMNLRNVIENLAFGLIL
jgi:DNA polymerase III delta prime subunit